MDDATTQIALLIGGGLGVRTLAWVIKGAALWRWAGLTWYQAALTGLVSDIGAGLVAGAVDQLLYGLVKPAADPAWAIDGVALGVYVVVGLLLVAALNLRHPNRRRLLVVAAIAGVAALAVTMLPLLWIAARVAERMGL